MIVETRCPACGAALRAGAPWCTLCYADLRPPTPTPTDAPAEPAESAATSGPSYSRPDPLTVPLAALDGPTWPCASCGAVNALAEAVCRDCGGAFLAGLRDQEPPLLQLPVVGDLMGMSRGQRVALAFGFVLAVVVLAVLAGLLFG